MTLGTVGSHQLDPRFPGYTSVLFVSPLHFITTVPLYALQSMRTVARVQSRVKTFEPGAVSSQNPEGVP